MGLYWSTMNHTIRQHRETVGVEQDDAAFEDAGVPKVTNQRAFSGWVAQASAALLISHHCPEL